MDIKLIRSRWAAVGAAVAITLGAGGIGLVSATSPTGAVAYVPITPCRLADLRPAPFTVGPRTTGLGPAETVTFDGWGTVGNCTLPSNTAALSLNVTAVGPTLATDLRLWPADAATPSTSNLNPAPGQPPTPNAVNVGLSAAGKFKILNKFGTVAVIIDVVGYYTDHSHTGADIVDGSIGSADIANNSVSNLHTSNEPGIAFNYNSSIFDATPTPASVVGTSIRVPSDGYISIEVTGLWGNGAAGEDEVWCQLQKGTVGAINTAEPWFILTDHNAAHIGFSVFSAHRVIEIAVADNPLLFFTGQSINLVCDEQLGAVVFDDVQISATFFATSYEPVGLVIFP